MSQPKSAFMPPRASSITHLHIASVLATELGPKPTIRILDAGCGKGIMLNYLREFLPSVFPATKIETYGFEVNDFAPPGHSFATEETTQIRSDQPWPYPDAWFDAVVSNQVLEHVRDHDFFFSQVRRVLRGDGISVHLAPVRECIQEGHVYVPMSHWLVRKHPAFTAKYARLAARLRIIRERAEEIPAYGKTDIGERVTQFLTGNCNYLTSRELIACARRHGFDASFRHTPKFYSAKLRAMIGKPPQVPYPRTWFSGMWLFKRLSSVTLVLRVASNSGAAARSAS